MKTSDLIAQKIISRKVIPSLFDPQFRNDHKLVFTNGCFDILHKGHLYLLGAARDLGDKLIIGLNTDNSVSRLKGENRPVKDQDTRAEILASLVYVDFVISLSGSSKFILNSLVKPDILVKGGDYMLEDIVGFDVVTAYGGSVQTIPFLEGFSSSSLINKLGKEQG